MKKHSFEKQVIFVDWKIIIQNVICVIAMMATFILLGLLFLSKHP